MRGRLFGICLVIGLMANSAFANEAFFRFFEGEVSEYVLTHTPAGAELVGKVTGTAADQVTDAAYDSFLQRLRWEASKALRNELAENMRGIQNSFSEYRVSKGRPAEVAPGEYLLPDEIKFLEDASAALKSNVIQDLLMQTTVFYEIPRAPEAAPEGARTLVAAAREIPELPIATAPGAADPIDLRAATLGWRAKIADRFVNYWRFFKAFRLSEGEWRTLFGFNGRQFTANDLAIIRKYNRLLDGLNGYARMRLMVRSFANERPALYTKLNEMTQEATAKYLNGSIGAEEYVDLRRAAAKELKLNEIVPESELRMLNALEKCKTLGGGKVGATVEKSAIELSETNMRAYQGHVDNLTQGITRETAELNAARGELASAVGEERAALESKIADLQRKLLKYDADKSLWKGRLDNEAKLLRKMYADFVDNHETLELFLNLRRGLINSEQVQPFDMADPFVATQDELKAWADFYDRALYNSTNEMVLNETQLFFKTRVGNTRTFVRSMNDMTGKYFGKKFTETALGQEFLDYNRHIAVETLARLGKLVGITVPSSVGLMYADKLWNYMFGDHKPNPGDEPAPGDDGDQPATGGGTHPGAHGGDHPAPGGDNPPADPDPQP